MKKKLVNKTLVFGVILLFFGIAVVPSIGSVSVNKPGSTETITSLRNHDYDGNTLYVGGTGPGNYSTIQSAIDDASHWDTIFVYSGIYNENIVINKILNLIGENRGTTIIKGQGNQITVDISVRLVTFQGFTIRNNNDGIGIDSGGVDIIIQNNTIKNCNVGMELPNMGYAHIIDNNTIMYNDYGIYMLYRGSPIKTNSIISKNDFGIYTLFITNNIISRNNYGILTSFVHNMYLKDNIISENQKGIFLGDSDCNRIFRNNF